jgi:hypothetical protein
MMSEPTEPTWEKVIAKCPPAEDVTDLDTARRYITGLRKMITQMATEAELLASAGGYWIDLDNEHDHMAHILYEQRKLAYEQENDAYAEDAEFEEVLLDFIQGYIDVAWDMAQDEQQTEKPMGWRNRNRRMTPSA